MRVDDGLSALLDRGPIVELQQRIADGTATVGVVGLGYVGLPLLVAASAEGFPVIGLDADEAKVASLRGGRSYVVDVSHRDVRDLTAAHLTTDPGDLERAEVILVAVPTPLKDGTPDLSHVIEACARVAGALRPGRLVVLESTTYPGTTEEIVLPLLEASGLESERDFAVAYSPERIDPGSSWTIRKTPKLVSGVGPVATELAAQFYRKLVDRVVVTPSPREAEMAKLIENTFRQVNIALVNELATIAPDLGIDIWAALEAAATKPFGYMSFWPGPGVGGHCVAIDPTYLSWRTGQRRGYGLRFVQHAQEVNNAMPGYVATRIAEALNSRGKPVKGSRILALGLTYKPEVNDVRESPAVAVMQRLIRAGAECSFHDPYVASVRLSGEEFTSQRLLAETVAAQDCVAILTAHPEVDYAAIVEGAQLVFDARGVTRNLRAENVVRL